MKKHSDEPEVKISVSPGFANSALIFEQVTDHFYLVFDRASQKYHVFPYKNVGMTVENCDYVPLARLPWPSVTLPKDVDDPATLPQTKDEFIDALKEGPAQNLLPTYETEESLFNEIRDFLFEYLDLPDELLYDVYSCFIMMTWRVEDFRVVPYLFFLGPLASGKTRALECLHYLGYRGLMASSMTAAAIFRSIESWHCLLLLDEAEVYNRECMVEVLALLNSGYRKGQYAIRIERLVKDGPPELGMFDVFGPKCIAGTEELAATLQSRCVVTAMSKNVRHVPVFIDEDKALEIRSKLLMYRFKNLGTKPQYDVLSLNGQFSNARVIELFVSLLEVAPSEAVRERLIQCMRNMTQSRLDEEQASVEARVFDAILKSADYVDGGKISTQAITDIFNSGLPEKEQVKSRFVGRQVAALGFEKCRVGKAGQSGFFWELKLIARLQARYYPIPSKLTSVTSVTSETTADKEKQRKLEGFKTEVTEVIQTTPVRNRTPEKTVTAEVTEQSEVTEVVLKPSTEVSHDITCGSCHKWHTGACSFPGDPACIVPDNLYAVQCGEYEP